MKYSKITISKLALITLLFFNCSKSDDNGETASDCGNIDIPFLIEGNTWDYDVKVFGSIAAEIKLTVGNFHL